MDILSTIFRETNGGEEGLPLLFSSFRLFARLKSMAEGDSNDDLQDAWSEQKTGLFNELASTIGKFGKSEKYWQVLATCKSQADTKTRLHNHIPPTA